MKSHSVSYSRCSRDFPWLLIQEFSVEESYSRCHMATPTATAWRQSVIFGLEKVRTAMQARTEVYSIITIRVENSTYNCQNGKCKIVMSCGSTLKRSNLKWVISPLNQIWRTKTGCSYNTWTATAGGRVQRLHNIFYVGSEYSNDYNIAQICTSVSRMHYAGRKPEAVLTLERLWLVTCMRIGTMSWSQLYSGEGYKM